LANVRRRGLVARCRVARKQVRPEDVIRGLVFDTERKCGLGLRSGDGWRRAELLQHGEVGGCERLVEGLREVASKLDRLAPAAQRAVRMSQTPERVRLPGAGMNLKVPSLHLL